ncbi:pyruvate dehydrogenase [Amycolatopsis ultiminotia]|uniref:Pyruvate dehydrogenase E1 component n=1 Tax=Amycolatopsis ultiminotia TaxID=543629 RepID=A0ABP6WII9_9PSEU
MTPTTASTGLELPAATDGLSDEVFAAIEARVLWLATAIVDHANHARPNPTGLKVGGHQAPSASMVTVMTSLWFSQLQPDDRVSVKPHASPVLHAINYLLGELDQSYLPTLRQFAGLQSYPSRTKDPDPVGCSTGSVGIGATAPIWGALARRYVDTHFAQTTSAPWAGTGRQYSLLGDAELDEGACSEAILDPMVTEFGEVVWIVDLNRQSLDRVVPDIGANRLQGMFTAAGWRVISVKYGAVLQELSTRNGGAELRDRIDTMSNPEYQRLLRCDAGQLRARLPGQGRDAASISALLDTLDDKTLLSAVRNLGGHDHRALADAFAGIDDTRPPVIFAYPVKGYGLATEEHPQNHSALLSPDQLSLLADRVGTSVDDPWATFSPDSAEARWCQLTHERLRRQPTESVTPPPVPTDLGRTPTGIGSTQAALGRTLLDLNRAVPAVGERNVALSPDVTSSTNLAGGVNKVGVWSAVARDDWFSDYGETFLHRREQSSGRHIELGIAETNLVGALGELGTTWSRWGQPLLPIGVVYDPFVERALEPWSFGTYAGGQSILVGTPSGVSLAPEGGAHQSIKTPSIGLEQPGCVTCEPASALDTGWMLLESIAKLGRPGGTSAYLRLSTRPIDQSPANIPDEPDARERRRRHAVAGGYLLRRATSPAVTICVVGAMTPQAVEAAERLESLGYLADVVCVTRPDLLFRGLQARRGVSEAAEWILTSILPADRARPMVTVLDGHPHTLAFLATVNNVPATHLGVSGFGQSGDLDSVSRYHGIDTSSIVGAALDLLD